MSALTYAVQIKLSWWVIPYLRACALFAWLSGMEPDVDKITSNVLRGVKLRMEAK